MFKQFFGVDILTLPVVGMLIFIGIFVGVLCWVQRRGSGTHYTKMADLPLEDGSGGDGGMGEAKP